MPNPLPLNAIFSIHPQYVDLILSGEKRFEFRRTAMRRDPACVFVYTTAPVRKIALAWDFVAPIIDSPGAIWRNCSDRAGIGMDDFFKYFQNRKRAIAYPIGKIRVFDPPLDPRIVEATFVPPQSFRYVNWEA